MHRVQMTGDAVEVKHPLAVGRWRIEPDRKPLVCSIALFTILIKVVNCLLLIALVCFVFGLTHTKECLPAEHL